MIIQTITALHVINNALALQSSESLCRRSIILLYTVKRVSHNMMSKYLLVHGTYYVELLHGVSDIQ